MNKKLIIGGITLVIILMIVGSVRKESDPVSKETIKIGGIFALTGIGAPIGTEERNGALLAIEEVNRKGIRGKQLEFISEDLGFSNLKLGAAVASKLVSVDKVHAIVGPQWDEPADVILPVIEANKVPTISGDVTNDIEKTKNHEYFFSTWFDNRSGIRKLLSYAQENNIKTVAIIRPVDGGFWKFTADLVTSYAPEYGITIVDDLKLSDPFTTDYRTTLSKVKAMNPDAVFVVVTDPTQCPFMKQMSDLKLNIPVLSTEAAGSHASLETCGPLLTNLYFSTPAHTDAYTVFERAYEERFGRKPQYPSAVTTYDAVKVIAQALEATDGARGEKLMKEIAATKNHRGASLESITFDEKGFTVTPLEAWKVQTVRNGTFVDAK